jgi:hypothetical protein
LLVPVERLSPQFLDFPDEVPCEELELVEWMWLFPVVSVTLPPVLVVVLVAFSPPDWVAPFEVHAAIPLDGVMGHPHL